MEFKLRDYQHNTVINVFKEFGITPAGPDIDEQAEINFDRCGDGVRENDSNGRDCETLADRPSNDDQPPF